MNLTDKATQAQTAVLDIAIYFAVFDIPVSLERLVAFMPIKVNHLAVGAAVRDLIVTKQLQRVGDAYGLAGKRYRGLKQQRLLREQLLKKAQATGRWLGLLPFVKAVVVVNNVALGNVRASSDIDLVVVTTPGRIFVAHWLVSKLLRLTRQGATKAVRAGKIDIDMYLTVRGVPLERDLMQTTVPHLRYWLLSAIPVYGAKRWGEVLQASPYLRVEAPNMLWPRGGQTIDRWSWRWLDSWDDRGYRVNLKRVSQDAATQAKAAFIRIRPDIINLHTEDKSTEIAARWVALQKSLEVGPVRSKRKTPKSSA